jgi:hypothetical protein
MQDDMFSTPEVRITAALAQARKYRHHRDCHCRMFDRQYCNASDKLWQRAVNRELDKIIEARDRVGA